MEIENNSSFNAATALIDAIKIGDLQIDELVDVTADTVDIITVDAVTTNATTGSATNATIPTANVTTGSATTTTAGTIDITSGDAGTIVTTTTLVGIAGSAGVTTGDADAIDATTATAVTMGVTDTATATSVTDRTATLAFVGDLSGVGTLSASTMNVTGMLTADTLTDSTVSISSGVMTGLADTNISVTTSFGDGVASITGGVGAGFGMVQANRFSKYKISLGGDKAGTVELETTGVALIFVTNSRRGGGDAAAIIATGLDTTYSTRSVAGLVGASASRVSDTLYASIPSSSGYYYAREEGTTTFQIVNSYTQAIDFPFIVLYFD